MSKKSYELVVENGDVKKEEGYFFQAAPFVVKTGGTQFDVLFERSDHHKVYFRIVENGKVLFELTHPEYVPLESPASLAPALQSVFAALLKTGVSKEKNYIDYFQTHASHTYEIVQEAFL